MTREPLADLATWVNGLAFTPNQFAADGVPIIKIAELKGGVNEQTKRTRAQFDDRFRVRAGDLLYSWSGSPETSLDAFWWNGEDGWLNQHIFRVIARDDVLKPYLYYLLKSLRPTLVGIARDKQTTGLGHVTRKDLERLLVDVSSVEDQHEVVGALGALDGKIDLNTRIATTAHELAHAIFRSRYRSDDPRLPHEPLGEHVEVARGLSYTGSGLADDGVPLHNLNSIYEGGGYKRDGIKHYTGDYQPRHLVEEGDVVVATVEQGFEELLIGFPARIPRCFGTSGIFSQDLFRLRPRAGSALERTFVYLMLLRGHLHEEIAGYANGTTINRIPVEALQKPRFAVPPRALVEEVDALVAPLFDRAEAAEDESETLAQLRDTLLPKLISGELRLRDVA